MNLIAQPIRRALIAASDPLKTRLLQQAVTAQGYSVQSVTNGPDAKNMLLGAVPPCIALLEASLPDSLVIAAEIKRGAEKNKPWIILFGEIAGLTDDIDDLLLEPENEAELRIRLSLAEKMEEKSRQLDEQKHAVRFHASHDSLTGLWNRESILSLLFPETDRVQRAGSPLALLLLDLDQFGQFNLDHGYDCGDTILQEIASRFRRHLRSYDLIGRCGEDEFLLALPGCTPKQALSMAARIRTLILHHPFSVGRHKVSLTASMGLAQSRGRSPLAVLREAEFALAKAKQIGRNCVLEYVPAKALNGAISLAV